MKWSDDELDILRRPITLSEMHALLPHRSEMSLRLRRLRLAEAEGFTVVNPTPDYSSLGKLSGEQRRITEEENKARFILAVSRGKSPTHNEEVARSTYQRWRKAYPEFADWFETFKRERKAERERIRNAARKPRKPRKVKPPKKVHLPMGENLRRSILQCDVYRVAAEAIGNRLQHDARDAAISAMVLDLLEGFITPDECASVASRYRTAANQEIAFKPLSEARESAYSYQVWSESNE